MTFSTQVAVLAHTSGPRPRNEAGLEPPPAAMVQMGSAKRLVLVCAPPGFGKTDTLAAEWRRRCRLGQDVMWLDARRRSTDAGDASPTPAALPARGAVFVDAVTPAHAHLLGSLLEVAPSEVTVYIACRHLAGLGLARRLVEGEAELIGGRDLLWSRAMLLGRWKEVLPTKRIAEVHALTEGWPGPSRLLLQWLARSGSLGAEGPALHDSGVMAYLDDEVVACLPLAWREALAAAAVAGLIDQSLLDRFGGEASLRIEELGRELSTLLIPTEAPGESRLNHLLALHLRHGSERWRRKDRMRLKGVLTDWLAERGDLVAAAKLAVEEEDGGRIGGLVARAGGAELWLTKGYDVVRELVRACGPAIVAADPRLMLLHCIVLLKDGRIGEAERVFSLASPVLPNEPDALRDAALVRASLLIYGCYAETAADEEQYALLDRAALSPGWRTMLPTLQAIRRSQQAQFADARAALLEAEVQARASGVDYNLMFLAMHTAGVELAQGELKAAGELLLSADRRRRARYPRDSGAETVLYALRSSLAFEQGRLDQARRCVARSGHRLPSSEAWLDIYVAGLEPMLRLMVADQGLHTALAAVDRLAKLLAERSLPRVASLVRTIGLCLEGEQALRAGGGGDHPSPPLAMADAFATWQEREMVGLATAYAALTVGAFAQADAELATLIARARERGLGRTLLRALLLQACAADLGGREDAAAVAVAEALSIGARTGMLQAFHEFGGRPVRERLRSIQSSERNDPEAAFARSLGRLSDDGAAAPRALTRRERQIVDELASGGSDKAIARRLGVTEHAVRFHLKNVYAKLGVNDRVSAVSAAAKAKPTR